MLVDLSAFLIGLDEGRRRRWLRGNRIKVNKLFQPTGIFGKIGTHWFWAFDWNWVHIFRGNCSLEFSYDFRPPGTRQWRWCPFLIADSFPVAPVRSWDLSGMVQRKAELFGPVGAEVFPAETSKAGKNLCESLDVLTAGCDGVTTCRTEWCGMIWACHVPKFWTIVSLWARQQFQCLWWSVYHRWQEENQTKLEGLREKLWQRKKECRSAGVTQSLDGWTMVGTKPTKLKWLL